MSLLVHDGREASVGGRSSDTANRRRGLLAHGHLAPKRQERDHRQARRSRNQHQVTCEPLHVGQPGHAGPLEGAESLACRRLVAPQHARVGQGEQATGAGERTHDDTVQSQRHVHGYLALAAQRVAVDSKERRHATAHTYQPHLGTLVCPSLILDKHGHVLRPNVDDGHLGRSGGASVVAAVLGGDARGQRRPKPQAARVGVEAKDRPALRVQEDGHGGAACHDEDAGSVDPVVAERQHSVGPRRAWDAKGGIAKGGCGKDEDAIGQHEPGLARSGDWQHVDKANVGRRVGNEQCEGQRRRQYGRTAVEREDPHVPTALADGPACSRGGAKACRTPGGRGGRRQREAGTKAQASLVVTASVGDDATVLATRHVFSLHHARHDGHGDSVHLDGANERRCVPPDKVSDRDGQSPTTLRRRTTFAVAFPFAAVACSKSGVCCRVGVRRRHCVRFERREQAVRGREGQHGDDGRGVLVNKRGRRRRGQTGQQQRQREQRRTCRAVKRSQDGTSTREEGSPTPPRNASLRLLVGVVGVVVVGGGGGGGALAYPAGTARLGQ
mmetsp:Transcript_12550/g.39654  ORF Transcript_12550/g.39654 Transcript_12550/m.39654 type:complete len:556 (+) Transcript_12550:1098-2765(+)